MSRLLPALVFILLTMWASMAVAQVQAGKRVALIIGNASYASFGKLDNPSNDAEDVAAALKKIGFTVIEGRDLSKRDMDRRLAQFSRAASDAETAIVYYAGHGLQYQNQNYLVPTDAQLKDGFDIPYETIPVDSVIGALDNARGARIMILDACRNLPLAEGVKRGSGTGLARVVGRDGLIIAYATQSNQVAFDGTGRNSPYAEALARSLAESGLEVGQVFQRVAMAVKTATQGKQLPEFSRSYADEVFLNRAETDTQAWGRLRNSNVVADLSAFIERFPASFLADAARIRIQLLENQARYAEQEAENKRQEERRAQERQLWARREEEQNRREQARLDAEKSRREEEQNQAELARLTAQRQAEDARREALRREEAARREQARVEAETLARQAAAEILRREEAARLARIETEKTAALEKQRRDESARQEQARIEAEKAAKLAALEQQRRDEVARLEQARIETEKATKLAALEQQRRDEAARQEQARVEAEKAAKLAALEQQRREEAARQEQARIEAEKAAKLAALEQQRRDESARQEQARAEAEKAAKLAALEQQRRDESARQEQARAEAEKAAKLAALEQQRRDEAARQEQARAEAEKAAKAAALEKQWLDEAVRQEQIRVASEKAAQMAALEQQGRDEAARREQARLDAEADTVRAAALKAGEDSRLASERAAKAAAAGANEMTGGFALSADVAKAAVAVADKAVQPQVQAEAKLPHTAYASLDLKEAANPKATAPGSANDLFRKVQRRLTELGCYTAEPEATWGWHSAVALENFYASAKRIDQVKLDQTKLASSGPGPNGPAPDAARNGLDRSIRIASAMPDQLTLDDLNSYSGRICPMVCPAGSEPQGEACVKVTCPGGTVLSESVCVPGKTPATADPSSRIRKATRSREPVEPKVSRPTTKPTVRIVQPVRTAPKVPALSPYTRSAPARATASSAPSVGPIEIGAVRAMSRMP